jgi:hypothetical protein
MNASEFNSRAILKIAGRSRGAQHGGGTTVFKIVGTVIILLLVRAMVSLRNVQTLSCLAGSGNQSSIVLGSGQETRREQIEDPWRCSQK